MQAGDRVRVLDSVPYWGGSVGYIRSMGIETEACSVMLLNDGGKPRCFFQHELAVADLVGDSTRWQPVAELSNLARECWGISIDHGFYEDVETTDVEWQGMKIALMHSELSEALEATRKGIYTPSEGEHSVEEEFADVIIRILEQSHALGLNIGQAVVDKIEKNRSRPYKHGKRC